MGERPDQARASVRVVEGRERVSYLVRLKRPAGMAATELIFATVRAPLLAGGVRHGHEALSEQVARVRFGSRTIAYGPI